MIVGKKVVGRAEGAGCATDDEIVRNFLISGLFGVGLGGAKPRVELEVTDCPVMDAAAK